MTATDAGYILLVLSSIVALWCMYYAMALGAHDAGLAAGSGPIEALLMPPDQFALLQQVSARARSFRKAKGYDPDDMDEALSWLHLFEGKQPVLSSRLFKSTLESIIDSLHGTNDGANIDLLVEKFDSVINSRRGILFTLMQHYGLRVLGSEDFAATDAIGRANFERYAGLLQQKNLAEISLPYLAILAHSEGNSVQSSSVLEKISKLTESERLVVEKLNSTLRDASKIAQRPTAQVLLMAQRAEAFSNGHPPAEASQSPRYPGVPRLKDYAVKKAAAR